jgi:ELWxxDGT repeat protein
MFVMRSLLSAGVVLSSSFTFLPAQQLVADLATGAAVASSSPRGFVDLGNCLVFAAATPDAGREPWRTDGTAAGTFRLRDLVRGASSSSPTMLGGIPGGALFSASVSGGVRLYRTDGTVSGTLELPALSIPQPLRSAVDLGTGRVLLDAMEQLYGSDLTAAGTVPLPGMVNFQLGLLVGGVAYGSCLVAGSTFELWRTDGTVLGSQRIGVLQSNARPGGFLAWNGRIYFVERAITRPGSVSSTDGISVTRHALLPSIVGLASERLFERQGRLLFDYDGGLFESDLTPTGTQRLAVPCTDVRNLIEFGGRFYFRAASAAGYELWSTDGTVTGTAQVADLMPGLPGSHPEHLQATPQALWLRALLPTGRRLLRIDLGHQIADLGPIPNAAPSGFAATSPISGFMPLGGGVVFAAADDAGDELWSCPAQGAPARLLDLAVANGGLLLTTPRAVAVAGERLLFAASRLGSGDELVSTDGTLTGTHWVEFVPGTAGEFQSVRGAISRYGDRFAFVSRNRAAVTDGTLAGTVSLLTPTPYASDVVCKVRDRDLWFLTEGVLYRSDGTQAGTVLVVPRNQVVDSFGDFAFAASRLVLAGNVTIYGSDGVAPPQPVLQVPTGRVLHEGNGRVLVVAREGVWATDGTAVGTVSLLASPSQQIWPNNSVRRGDTVYFLVGSELYATDGTPAGTRRLGVLPAGASVESPFITRPSPLVVTDRNVLLVASTPATGRELWRLDPALGQFALVRDFAPGPFDGVDQAVALGDGDLALVAAGDEAVGNEPFATDGTSAGTFLLADIHPGAGNSSPQFLGLAGARILMLADDGVHGRELWSVPVPLAGAAALQDLGFGCGGRGAAPSLTARGAPRLGDASFGFTLAGAPSVVPVALGVATAPGLTMVAGCELRLGGSQALTVGTSTFAGSANFGLPVPAGSWAQGVRLALQGFALDTLAPRGFSATAGLWCTFGR